MSSPTWGCLLYWSLFSGARWGLTYLQSLRSPVYYGIKIDWDVLGPPLRTGVAAVTVLVLAAAVYPVIYSRRLETVEVLRAT